jgi:uncharacterized membrane protein YhhN
MKKIALILFCFSVTGVLLDQLLATGWLFTISKPLIMVSLLLYYWYASSPEYRSKVLILAIIFSLAGDVLLMKDQYFIAGLIAFLISHILYIFAYREFNNEDSGDALNALQRVRLAFPIILAGSGLIVILFPVLGDLKIPVVIYAMVLAFMVITALFRFGRTNPKSFWMVFSGAVLFMTSDSILAINKFLSPVAGSGVLIMSTYMAAQFLIIQGLLKHTQRQVS